MLYTLRANGLQWERISVGNRLRIILHELYKGRLSWYKGNDLKHDNNDREIENRVARIEWQQIPYWVL